MANPTDKLAPPARDKLVRDHLPYAHAQAAKVRHDLSSALDLEELSAYAVSGLVEAADRFDPTRGAAFTTFAYYRIRGAIYDGLRKAGWLSRSAYGRYCAGANELLDNLGQRQQSRGPDAVGPRPAAEADPASALTDLAQTLDQVATIFVVTLDDNVEAIPDAEAADPVELLDRKRTRLDVQRAVASLPDREREIMQRHYFKGQTLEQAGKDLGLSKSWASRLHARAIKLLTEALGSTFPS